MEKKKQAIVAIIGCMMFWLGMTVLFGSLSLYYFKLVLVFYAIASAIIGVEVVLLLKNTFLRTPKYQ